METFNYRFMDNERVIVSHNYPDNKISKRVRVAEKKTLRAYSHPRQKFLSIES